MSFGPDNHQSPNAMQIMFMECLEEFRFQLAGPQRPHLQLMFHDVRHRVSEMTSAKFSLLSSAANDDAATSLTSTQRSKDMLMHALLERGRTLPPAKMGRLMQIVKGRTIVKVDLCLSLDNPLRPSALARSASNSASVKHRQWPLHCPLPLSR